MDPAPSAPGSALLALRVEAARYALLRRLSPSIRHHLVVNLQPIGMIHEVMHRRLRTPEPDLDAIRESASKINGFARAALHSCIDIVSWIAPEADTTAQVTDTVRECVGLLTTSLSFRGYALRSEVGALEQEAPRAAVRQLLTATLLHCTDHTEPPAELVLRAEVESREQGSRVLLTLLVRSGGPVQGFSAEQGYRPITWEDIHALAVADGVDLQRAGHGFTMRLPAAVRQAAVSEA